MTSVGQHSNYVYNEFYIEMFELREVDSINCYREIPMYKWVTVSSLRAFLVKMDYHIGLGRLESKVILSGIRRAFSNFHHIELAVGEFNK